MVKTLSKSKIKNKCILKVFGEKSKLAFNKEIFIKIEIFIENLILEFKEIVVFV